MLLQRGYESESLKVYMRLTALLVDLICLFPPVYLISNHFQRQIPQLFLLIFLLKPDSILIDHGHFQYNSLILGLILTSFYCLFKQYWYMTCFFFTIAIHSKQMAVYYALAFLAGLIGMTFSHYRYNRLKFFGEIIKYAFIVVGVSLILWAPWFGSIENLQSVVTAIFPVHRGLYQLKVPNFWCISDIIFNWESLFSKSTLVILCFLSSSLLSLPSMFSMILNPTKKSFILGFATISMTFFMFSYHVHEKSILLPLLMMPLVAEVVGGWLTHELILAGCFGLFHLLREDGQEFGYFGIVGLYFIFSTSYTILREKVQETEADEMTLDWHSKLYENKLCRLLFVVVAVLLHILALTVTPPSNLPYLWHLLFAFLSFLFNFYFLLLGNLLHL
jgi:alpha-1,3-glucosyltransferase